MYVIAAMSSDSEESLSDVISETDNDNYETYAIISKLLHEIAEVSHTIEDLIFNLFGESLLM